MISSELRSKLVLVAVGLLVLVAMSTARPAAADGPRQEGTAVPLEVQPDDGLPDAPGGDVLAPPETNPTDVPGGGGQDPLEPPSSSGDAGTDGSANPGGNNGSGDDGGSGNAGNNGSDNGGGRPNRPTTSDDDSGGFLCFSPALALLALGAVGLIFDRRAFRKVR